MRAMKRAGCAVSALILALALVLGMLLAVPVFADAQGQEDTAEQPVKSKLVTMSRSPASERASEASLGGSDWDST